MARAAAFLNGLLGGIETRQRWDDAAQRRKDSEEDRVWTREERKRRVEDREDERRIREEDRAERRRIQADNEAWSRKQRARMETAWGREDTRYAEEQGDKKAYADAYSDAQTTREADLKAADLRNARVQTGLGILPPESAPDTYIIPGSSLERMAEERQRPQRPAALGLSGAQPTTTAEDTVIPPYQGALPTPTMDAPPGAVLAPAAAPPPAGPRRSFLQMINPFSAADAATLPPTAPPPGPPGPQAVEPPQLGIRNMLMREPAPNPPAVNDAAPPAPAPADVLPIPAPRRVAPPPAAVAPQVLPETTAGGMPPEAASAPPAPPSGPGAPIIPVAPPRRSPATAEQPMPEPGVPMAMQVAERQGVGNVAAMRAGVDPRTLPPSDPGRSPSGPATPSQEIAKETLLGPRRRHAGPRAGPGARRRRRDARRGLHDLLPEGGGAADRRALPEDRAAAGCSDLPELGE